MAHVETICTSVEKGEQKRPVELAELVADHGLVGDGHAGRWHRQVSLLAAEEIAKARQDVPDLKPGDFGENIIVRGLDFATLGLGSRLRLGPDAIVTITQRGKACHAPCRIGRLTGDCIMPRVGLFGRVEQGGVLRPGDEVEILEIVPPAVLQTVVLTISDRCSRGKANDTAGPAVARRLREGLGSHIYRTHILPDDRARIAAMLRHYADGHSIDLVVTVGGTGFSPRDVTPEATRDVVERPTPGLDEAMRTASRAVSPHAVLSRGASGIRGQALIINVPGSERAAVENLDAVLPSLVHGLAKLRGDPSDCGRTTG